MEEFFLRIWENLTDRVTGPMWFRLIMQPLMAAIFAVRAAINDAREGNPGYFWAVITHKDKRRDLLKEGWASVAKVFVMAILIDGIYQFIVQRWIYPGELLIIAFVLAVVPYILIRGPVNRLIRRYHWVKEKIKK